MRLLIAGKTDGEIISMTNQQRCLWYKEILPEEKGKAMEIVNIEMRSKVSKAYTPERRYKRSQSMMGGNNPNYGGFSEEHKSNISKAWTPERRIKQSIDRTGEKHPMYGKRGKKSHMYGKNRSKETKKKISKSHIGKINSQHSERMRGEKNPNWNGGTSYEPYGIEFNNKLREQIRKRDNYVCQECGKIQDELGRKLDVHHIDYDKTNNKPENLISLCNSCHSKTNFGREDWIEYFRKMIGGD